METVNDKRRKEVMAKKKAIIVSGDADISNYLVLTTGIDEVKDLMQETMGDEGLAPHELDRAVNPQGKIIKWGIPNIEGELDMVGEIEGVILYHTFNRNLWEEEYGKGEKDARPICSSIDGVTGVGTPGGLCKPCPFAQFGSAKNNSQACAKTKHIFILREDELLPLLVVLTSGSLKTVKKYFRRLFSHQIRPYQIVTKLKLTGPHTSKSGYDYAIAELSLEGRLDGDTATKMRAYSEYLRPWLVNVRTELSDVKGDSVSDNEEGQADEDAFDSTL
jgi:hypothetical protein